jgi:predicted TIM-barrel enzyme
VRDLARAPDDGADEREREEGQQRRRLLRVDLGLGVLRERSVSAVDTLRPMKSCYLRVHRHVGVRLAERDEHTGNGG